MYPIVNLAWFQNLNAARQIAHQGGKGNIQHDEGLRQVQHSRRPWKTRPRPHPRTPTPRQDRGAQILQEDGAQNLRGYRKPPFGEEEDWRVLLKKTENERQFRVWQQRLLSRQFTQDQVHPIRGIFALNRKSAILIRSRECWRTWSSSCARNWDSASRNMWFWRRWSSGTQWRRDSWIKTSCWIRLRSTGSGSREFSTF